MKHNAFTGNDKKFLLFLGIVLLLFWLIFSLLVSKKGDYVEVRVDGNLFGTYSLSEDIIVEITDSQGIVTNYLEIKDGKADMTSANCPDKTCVSHNAISKQNESIVCLPNQIIVTVFSWEESDLDAITN